MTGSTISSVLVSYMRDNQKLPMGRLALKNRNIFFEYDAAFLETGLQLSPYHLPLIPGIIPCTDRMFEGLFGVFNDSLPDGWGRLLLDRKCRSLGIQGLSPLDRLCYVGQHGMGALMYEPEFTDEFSIQTQDLDIIADEIQHVQTETDDDFVEELLQLNGSSAGARPKILTKIDKTDWLIKFRSSSDPVDIGAIEYAYHTMAKAALLDVPEAQLFKSKNGPGYFGVQRFDRLAGTPIHMHTVGGLLYADHRFPSLDYEILLKATLSLTKDIAECEKQFRAAVFNVLSHNRDDHAKNFSFLMQSTGKWKTSPAYDLTYSSGPAGEHSTTIFGEGKAPTRAHFLKLAEIISLSKPRALEIIDQVAAAVSTWREISKNTDASPSSQKNIQTALNQVFKDFSR